MIPEAGSSTRPLRDIARSWRRTHPDCRMFPIPMDLRAGALMHVSPRCSLHAIGFRSTLRSFSDLAQLMSTRVKKKTFLSVALVVLS